MDLATQPPRLDRLMSLDPFDPPDERASPNRKAQSREPPPVRQPVDLGCVDWYLYPVSRKPRQTER